MLETLANHEDDWRRRVYPADGHWQIFRNRTYRDLRRRADVMQAVLGVRVPWEAHYLRALLYRVLQEVGVDGHPGTPWFNSGGLPEEVARKLTDYMFAAISEVDVLVEVLCERINKLEEKVR